MRSWFLYQYLVVFSVVDQNTLNLDPDPGFWPNLGPDPGLYKNNLKKKLKIILKKLVFCKNSILKKNNNNKMSLTEIFSQLSVESLNCEFIT